MTHHRWLVSPRTQARKRLHAVLRPQQIVLSDGKPFIWEQRAWWVRLAMGQAHRYALHCDVGATRSVAERSDRELTKYEFYELNRCGCEVSREGNV